MTEGTARVTRDDLAMLDQCVEALGRTKNTELFLALGVYRLRVAQEAGFGGNAWAEDDVFSMRVAREIGERIAPRRLRLVPGGDAA